MKKITSIDIIRKTFETLKVEKIVWWRFSMMTVFRQWWLR